MLGANVQGRYNPKDKSSDLFDADGDFVASASSRATPATARTIQPMPTLGVGTARSRIVLGFYIRTDRDEPEHAQYLEPTRTSLAALKAQYENIKQDNSVVERNFALAMVGGSTELELSYAGFKDDTVATAYEADLVDERRRGNARATSAGRRVRLEAAHNREFGRAKVESASITSTSSATPTLQFGAEDGVFEDDTPPNGISTIDEARLDPYVMFEIGHVDAIDARPACATRHERRCRGRRRHELQRLRRCSLPAPPVALTDFDRVSLSPVPYAAPTSTRSCL